jgi:outer membrane receptor protein involved in Fe transport
VYPLAGANNSFFVSHTSRNQLNNDVDRFFRSDISNGIRWTPGSGSFFQAQNYLSLLSYGVEWTSSKHIELGSYKLNLSHNSSFTRSTIDEPRFSGDAAVNDQLPYVPKWKSSGAISVEKGKFGGSVFGKWVGERFSTEQNNLRNPEPSYFVLDASISYWASINNTEMKLNLQINNILNQEYEVVRLYPQPLRKFLITLTIKQKTN